MRMSEADVASAIQYADLRILLMVLVHLTGDERWLRPPYLPKRDVRLIPSPDAGFSPALQADIREQALRLFSRGIEEPAITDPGDDLMRRMMCVCLGEEVGPEYAPLMREEMAFISRVPSWGSTPSPEVLKGHHVLIVGAGVCGIALAVTLGKLGIPYTIVEQNDWIGGTWYVNRYPGCGVDTPNHAYSFSFEEPYSWSRYFSPREEVQDYLERTVKKFGLLPRIRFRTRVISAEWVSEKKHWVTTVETPDGHGKINSTILVSAIGQLSSPSLPAIAGSESFAGPSFHSAEWPEHLDIHNKRIAVIGTGATAMQLVPTIADTVASVMIYQRTPQWARPIAGYSDPIPAGARWLLDTLPFYAKWFRFSMFWRYGDGLLPFLRKDPSWPHPERSVNAGNDRHRRELTDFIVAELRQRPDLVPKCIPSYPPYGKRILLDNGWYRTLLKQNVELVTTPIRRIVSDGIITSDGIRRPADIIVYATGFKLTELAARLGISGRNKLPLATAWADENPTAYLGLAVPGFPNFFCMLGPNSGPAHGGSVIFQAECQTRYIATCIVGMIERGFSVMEVKQSVHDAYVKKVDSEHEQLIWTHPGMTTYYRNKKGRVFSVMPWRFVDYWAMTHDVDFLDYIWAA